MQVEGYSVGFDISPDGQYLVSGSATGAAVVYNYLSARTLTSLPVEGTCCLDVSWHPVLPSTLAMVTDDGRLVIRE